MLNEVEGVIREAEAPDLLTFDMVDGSVRALTILDVSFVTPVDYVFPL